MHSEIQQRLEQVFQAIQNKNLEKIDLIGLSQEIQSKDISRDILYEFLDIAHFNMIANHISETNQADVWLNNLVDIIKKSKY